MKLHLQGPFCRCMKLRRQAESDLTLTRSPVSLSLRFWQKPNSRVCVAETHQNVSEREADAESGPAKYQASQSHCPATNRPFRGRNSYHCRTCHLLRVQHRPQPMGWQIRLYYSVAFQFCVFMRMISKIFSLFYV